LGKIITENEIKYFFNSLKATSHCSIHTNLKVFSTKIMVLSERNLSQISCNRSRILENFELALVLETDQSLTKEIFSSFVIPRFYHQSGYHDHHLKDELIVL